MKICIAAQTFAPQNEGGAEISTRHMASNLAARHSVVVLALGMPGLAGAQPGECVTDAPYRLYRLPFGNSYLPEARPAGAGTIARAVWHGRNACGAVQRNDLHDFFSAEGFDVIYAQNSSRMQPALYDVAAQMNIPVCQHLRDYALLCPRTSMFANSNNCEHACRLCALLTARQRAASRHVGSVIAVSTFVKQRFVQHGLFSRAAFHVMHNTNTARADLDGTLLAARPLPETGFTFGYLGAITPHKGIDVLLDAFRRLPDSLPARLLIAGRGDGPFVAAMQNKTAELAPGRVEWLGHVRPEAVYRRAEVIVLPSLWHEPQSRVLIEAATYGVPVFAARTGGSPEIAQDQATGWCYEPNDSGQLAALMLDAACEGGTAWRARLAERFPGLAGFAGTAEASGYYARIETILQQARAPGAP